MKRENDVKREPLPVCRSDSTCPLWLEERIREALAEPAETTGSKQFDTIMAAIAEGR